MEATAPTPHDAKLPDYGFVGKHSYWDSANKSIVFDAPSGFVGQGALWFTSTAPDGWLLCDGTVVNIADYPRLFAVLGTTYGGDGTTTFGLPDLRGRVPLGVGTGSGLTARSLAATGGEETHQLSVAEMPSHSHLAFAGQATLGSGGTARTFFSGSSPNYSGSEAKGGSGSHNNMQPWLAINFIIKF